MSYNSPVCNHIPLHLMPIAAEALVVEAQAGGGVVAAIVAEDAPGTIHTNKLIYCKCCNYAYPV